jgi:hypothetical protein
MTVIIGKIPKLKYKLLGDKTRGNAKFVGTRLKHGFAGSPLVLGNRQAKPKPKAHRGSLVSQTTKKKVK